MKYPVYQPRLSGKEKKYVDDCLDSTWISSKGKYIKLFEKSFADYIGCKYATAVFNGTVALSLAIAALRINEGDEVIVPSYTYIASVNTIRYVKAVPVFVDCLRDTWQLDPEDVKRKITNKTKAIMAVHIYGHPCDMDRIKEIAKENNLYVIEDCAEAIGSEYKGKKVGSFGDVACFSFFGNKNITTGEGGMVLTNNEDIYKLADNLKTQGISYTKEYWFDRIGFNYRMTNIQAAIGLAQMEILEKNIIDKRRVFNKYRSELKNCNVEFLDEVGNVKNTYWMVSFLLKDEVTRDNLREYLITKGIETRPTFYGIHMFDMYKGGNNYPVTNDISVRGINVPSYPDLTDNDIEEICKHIKDFLNAQK